MDMQAGQSGAVIEAGRKSFSETVSQPVSGGAVERGTEGMVVTRLADGRVAMAGGAWRIVVALDEVPGWLRLYRRLWGRGAAVPGQPGPWAKFYVRDVAALEAYLAGPGAGA